MKLSQYYIPVILGLAFTVPSVGAFAQVAVGIGFTVPIAPPPLPIYVQPPIPARGYLWTPGFWSYEREGGYYWVPGTWVRPPSIGVLWTPPYWGFVGGVYSFNAGYWGPHVGFYGGINYGFGYGGNGYAGGRWSGGNFTYNRSVNNFGSTRITNVYNETITNNNVSRASFNGTGGIQAEANAEQQAMARERHMDATAEQSRHFQAAGSNRELRASENHGNPVIAATARPGQFRGRGVVAADEAEHGGSRSVLGREHGASASAPGHMARAAGEHPAHPDKPVNAARPAQAHAAASHHASQSRPARAPAADHASAPHAERAAAGPRPPHQAPQRVAATHAGATQHPAEARHSGNGGNDKQH